jgi:hypothetical protein
MIDLYYWQHSDRRWWLGLGEQTWRDETKRKEEICLGWDPPDEARSVVGTGRAGCVVLCGVRRAKPAGI